MAGSLKHQRSWQWILLTFGGRVAVQFESRVVPTTSLFVTLAEHLLSSWASEPIKEFHRWITVGRHTELKLCSFDGRPGASTQLSIRLASWKAAFSQQRLPSAGRSER